MFLLICFDAYRDEGEQPNDAQPTDNWDVRETRSRPIFK